MENGRSLWITVKGNNVLEQEITEDLKEHEIAVRGDVDKAFGASLETLLKYFRWCEQNWRRFIRDIEESLRKLVRVATTLPLHNEARLDTTVPLGSANGHESKLPHSTGNLAEERIPRLPDYNFVLNMLKYQDMQSLTTIALRIEDAALVAQLNLGVLKDAVQCYQDAVQSEDIKSPELRGKMEKSVKVFSLRVAQIIRTLETTHAQLVSLGTSDGIARFLVSNSIPYLPYA